MVRANARGHKQGIAFDSWARHNVSTQIVMKAKMIIKDPSLVENFLSIIREQHKTGVTICEPLTMGKSGAFVAIVECTGALDGIHILKVDVLPTEWDGEGKRHRKAIADGAFSGKLPQLALSLEADSHYCMLIKLAGQSRIMWRPLVTDHKLFRSAYTEFSKVSWTPASFTFGDQQTIGEAITALLGYKLSVDQGGGEFARILRNLFLRI